MGKTLRLVSYSTHYETRQAWFRWLLYFRADVEGRVSMLKRKFSLHRSLMNGSKAHILVVN